MMFCTKPHAHRAGGIVLQMPFVMEYLNCDETCDEFHTIEIVCSSNMEYNAPYQLHGRFYIPQIYTIVSVSTSPFNTPAESVGRAII